MKKMLKWVAVLAVLGFFGMMLVKVPALGLAEAEFCGMCHAMDYQVNTYLHSPHAQEANCGDCHDPHGLVTGSIYAVYTGNGMSIASFPTPSLPRFGPLISARRSYRAIVCAVTVISWETLVIRARTGAPIASSAIGTLSIPNSKGEDLFGSFENQAIGPAGSHCRCRGGLALCFLF